MSRGVNKAIILGNLGGDPMVNYTPGGTAVANVTVATNEQWTDKNSGEIKQRTEWHRCVFFGRLAEVVGEYLKKGARIYVEGRLQTRKWQDREGIDRYTKEIVANDMQMLGTRNDNGGDSNQGGRNARQNQGRAPAPSAMTDDTGAGNSQDFDDDIPF